MHRFLAFFVAVLITPILALSSQPVITDVDWESACGGSNIRVTRVDGYILSIDAEVEHYSEGRQWVCHFVNGQIISALYRHFTVKRKMAPGHTDDGAFTTEQHDDVVKTFHFPNHKLTGMDKELGDDLQDVITRANQKG